MMGYKPDVNCIYNVNRKCYNDTKRKLFFFWKYRPGCNDGLGCGLAQSRYVIPSKPPSTNHSINHTCRCGEELQVKRDRFTICSRCGEGFVIKDSHTEDHNELNINISIDDLSDKQVAKLLDNKEVRKMFVKMIRESRSANQS